MKRTGKAGAQVTNKIKFTIEWDKLDNPVFTTIRSWNAAKEKYYGEQIGKEFQVWKCDEKYPFVPRHVVFHAWLSKVFVAKPSDLPDLALNHDVMLNGVPDQKWKTKLTKMDKAIILTFSKSSSPAQTLIDNGVE